MSPVPNRITTYILTPHLSDLCSGWRNKIFLTLKHGFFVSTSLISLFIFTHTSLASTNVVSSISDIVVTRSTSGHYVVTGTNSVWNMYLMRWVEAVGIKVESLIDLEMPFNDSRLIRIVMSGKHTGSSEVAWSQGYAQGRFVQQLDIYDYLHTDIPKSEVAMCGLFLNGYVVSRLFNKNSDNSDEIKRRNNISLPSAPSWLALGVARNLYSAYRAENSEELLKIYDQGRLESVTELLQKFTDSEKDDELNKYACGMFVLWLSKLPGHSVVFDKLFYIIANEKPLTATELSSIINNCDSVKTMETMWREWVYRQKRMVYNPGLITPQVVEKLKVMLVITPEQCSMAGGPVISTALEFRELISGRKESWLGACARQKIIQLKLMFVGRGEDVNQVIDLYCDFLTALEKRKSKKKLRKLLNIADEAMMSFVEKY